MWGEGREGGREGGYKWTGEGTDGGSDVTEVTVFISSPWSYVYTEPVFFIRGLETSAIHTCTSFTEPVTTEPVLHM